VAARGIGPRVPPFRYVTDVVLGSSARSRAMVAGSSRCA